MKKVLVIVALICSLACVVASALSANVSADETITVGGESLTYDPNIDTGGKLPDTTPGESEVENDVKTAVGVLSGIVGVVSVGMIVWGGIMYSMSAGDPGKTQLAKRIIITAIIGLVLSLLATLIANIVITIVQKPI